MKFSENIQTYRKSLNMSQEELGKMLYVSRQTVSMWENGQTTPTIDNLIRLSEIFSVTVDELLKGENTLQDSDVKESYEFRFTNDELKEIQKSLISPMLGKTITLVGFMIILFLLLVVMDAPDILIGCSFGGLFIALISNMKAILLFKKSWKNSADKIIKSTYKYEIYEDSFELNILRDGDLIKNSFKYSDIENVQNLKNYYLIQISNQLFIVRKNALKENSILYSYLYKNPSKILEEKIPLKWKTASNILFILSLCSLILGLYLIEFISKSDDLFLEYSWAFFTLTPIPVSSLALGIIGKRKGYKFKKNIVAGIIMTILLCIYGSFVFIF